MTQRQRARQIAGIVAFHPEEEMEERIALFLEESSRARRVPGAKFYGALAYLSVFASIMAAVLSWIVITGWL